MGPTFEFEARFDESAGYRVAVVIVVVVLLTAFVLSARWNPVYQSRALARPSGV
ncbi:MAG: hypothetical protein LC799_23380 [Actinobacteria bacterium]|nr:hypothetical protein [Actinomycetota bacterium]